MRNYTLFILFLYSSIIYCQDCKYATNKVDDFTKSKVLETNYEWIGEQLGYTLSKIDDKRFLKMRIESLKLISINEGSKIMFLTGAEEPITLNFPKFEISKRSDGLVSTYYIVENILLSEELYGRFKNEVITKIRVYTSEGYFDKNIKDKRAAKFREQIKCIE